MAVASSAVTGFASPRWVSIWFTVCETGVDARCILDFDTEDASGVDAGLTYREPDPDPSGGGKSGDSRRSDGHAAAGTEVGTTAAGSAVAIETELHLFHIHQEDPMAGNPRPTFNKRQRERARQEKQQEKAQKRAQKKLTPDTPPPERPAELVVNYDEDGQPQGFDFHDFQ